MKQKGGNDEGASDHEEGKCVDIMEKQALKVIQLTSIRCSCPNKVAGCIHANFDFHNLADMWPTLCAVVDGRTDPSLLLAVDLASYKA